jgi:thiamine-monophosphate kinase
VLADIVLVGSAPAGRALRRSGGKTGDSVYVTGALGGAAAELATMGRGARKHPTLRDAAAKSGAPGFVAHPQMFPEPRLGVGQALLRRRLANAAIDLSDGLSTDLAHLCRESGVGAEVEAIALPIHPIAAKHGTVENALDLALNGGEDYELLFSASASSKMPRSIAGVPIIRIGRLVRGSTITLIDGAGRRQALKPGGWEHFGRSSRSRKQ